MSVEVDTAYLQAAVTLAERGLMSCTPNPAVGCLLVRDGQVLGRGWHMRAGEGHAEANALTDAKANGFVDVHGATAYVSLEPCAFHGRTPSCASALVVAGVTRVVMAKLDPHPRVDGAGGQILRDAGIATTLIETPEAAALQEGQTKLHRTGLPFVRIKAAMSMDGRTAMASGESQWITGPVARADVQYWRARSCAVLTGVGTVLADDPQLNVRDSAYAVDGVVRQPLRVVLDSNLATDPKAQICAGAGECVLLHAEHPMGDVAAFTGSVNCEALGQQQGGQRRDLTKALQYLGARGCHEVLVEAGATLVGAFIEQNLWDELLLYVAPKFLGSDGRGLLNLQLANMDQAIGAKIVASEPVGDDLRIRLRPAH